MLGTTVDSKYQIVCRLGQGGMGAVYEAKHLGTGRRVALKVIVESALVPGSDMLARFQREARASGAIDSQHVVQVLDTGVDPQSGSPYLVMEYLTGEDLQQVIQRVGALSVDVVLRIMAQACSGLTRAHEEGIVHRDIKSANLFVARREGGEVTLKILDFGIAKVRADPMSAAANPAITRTGALLGSPLYMSPEQVLGAKDTDCRTDVYSLGITMYEALCGVTPNHECETVGMLVVAICGGKGRPLLDRAPTIPPEVAAIVQKAVAIDPNARFQTMAELKAALTALLPRGTSTSLYPSMLVGSSPPPKAEASPSFSRRQNTAPLLTPMPAGPSAPDVAPPGLRSGSESSPAPALAATATALAGTNPTLLQRAPRWVLALPVALLALCGAGLGFYQVRVHDVSQTESTGSGLVTSLASEAASSPSSSLPSATAPDTSVSTNVDGAVTAPSSAPVVATAPAIVTARPRVTAPPTTAPVVPARPNCDPPFSFNSDGKKIWKRDCL